MRIDGKQISSTLLENIHRDVNELLLKRITPHLVVLLVGNDPASESYVRQKKLKGESIGMKVTVVTYPQEITEAFLLEKIKQLNNDSTVHGIVIQQPLPNHIDPHVLTEATDPRKDVDGFHSKSDFTPPIAEAALEILTKAYSLSYHSEDKEFTTWLKSQSVVVIGKGETGGTPIREKLERLGVDVAVIDSKTESPQELTKKADIIISCVGKPNVVKKDKIKKGVILLSVGMFRGDDNKLHGDYDEEDIKDIAAFYSPVPGGMGPVNVAMLLSNVIQAAKPS